MCSVNLHKMTSCSRKNDSGQRLKFFDEKTTKILIFLKKFSLNFDFELVKTYPVVTSSIWVDYHLKTVV
jgi:hypothetical protein